MTLVSFLDLRFYWMVFDKILTIRARYEVEPLGKIARPQLEGLRRKMKFMVF